MSIQHVGNYVLIGDIEGKHLSPTLGYKFLKRLFPHCTIPENYKKVNELNGVTVYEKDGLLKPEYWSLARYYCDKKGDTI